LEADYHITLNETLRQGRKRLYRYKDTSYSLPLIRINDEERNKILGAIAVLEHFEGEPMYDWARTLLMQIEGGLFDDSSTPVVSFQSNPDLKGIELFGKLLQAILTKRVLKLRYTPYGKPTFEIPIYPYYLKQFNDRWYLIAQAKGYDSYAHYALDRIDDFEEVAVPYKEPDTDFSEYFNDVIGVTVPETDPENVLLRISNSRYNYIKTKPLHSSWEIIEEGDNYTTISITVKINKELESLILSFGDDIEVLEPEDFRNRIAEKIKLMNQKYIE
jgi:predicted DNA-binding transcriptional regulator YafY